MNLGILEGLLWLIMALGFYAIAFVILIITAVVGFLCRHKFKLMFLAALSWLGYVGYKYVKTKEEDEAIINAKVVKDKASEIKRKLIGK